MSNQIQPRNRKLELTVSTDNRFGHTMSRYDLVFFRLNGVLVRYTDMTPDQQEEANKIYPVTFEARQAAWVVKS